MLALLVIALALSMFRDRNFPVFFQVVVNEEHAIKIASNPLLAGRRGWFNEFAVVAAASAKQEPRFMVVLPVFSEPLGLFLRCAIECWVAAKVDKPEVGEMHI